MIVENLRNFARERPTLSAGLSLIPVFLAVILYFSSQPKTGAAPLPAIEYVDEETGEELFLRTDEYPPLMGKSGKRTVVRANYLTASTVEKRFLAYYEKLTDEAKEKASRGKSQSSGPFQLTNEATFSGTVIRRPAPGSPWVRINSPEGTALMKQIYIPDPTQPPLRLCPKDQP